jgi:hypothetical protein
MYLKTIAVAAALASAAMTGASAQTVYHRQHHASLHHHSGYAAAYAATHSSLPTRPGYWNRGSIRTNTYPTYARGVGGCVDDLGYGRVGGGCR